ncbi:hypothetical protein BDF19DRAFT_346155, partial [Syncephalis fuscata]
MQLFSGLRKFNVPIMKTAWPFAVGGAVSLYLFGKAQNTLMNVEPFASDPRNP